MLTFPWRLYQSIFYHMYAWNLRTWGSKDTPEYNTAIWLSFLFLANVLNFNQAFELVVGYDLFKWLFGITNLLPLLILAFALVFHFFAFIWKSKFKKFETRFQDDSEISLSTRTFASYAYNIGTLATLLALLMLRREFHLVPIPGN